MSSARLRIDRTDVVIIEDKRFEVVRSASPGVEIRSTDKERKTDYKTHDELKKLYFDKKLTIQHGQVVRLPEGVKASLDIPLQSFSVEERAVAMKRLDYVHMCERYFNERRAPRTLKGYARVGRIVSWLRRRNEARETGRRPSTLGRDAYGASTLRDWHWRWRNAGRSVNALVPLDYLKGRNTPKTNSNTLAIVQRRVRDEWLTDTCPPLTVVYEGIVGEIEKFNAGLVERKAGKAEPIAVPSLSTVSRWVRSNIDDYDAVLMRKGRKEAERQFRGVRRAPMPTRPLQIVEVDHHLLDIEILDDNAPHGSRRPWLTVAICTTTRMIYGFHIGFETPSWLSVMACLRMGALPKDEIIASGRAGAYPLEGDWPVFGLPEVLVVDNGKDFHSNSLKAAAGQLGFELRYTPTRRPHLKGKVERFFGEVARNFLAFMPGRTFASIKEKGDYDPIAKAAITLDELKASFLIWAIDYHHNKPHRGIMFRAPLQCWNELGAYGVRVPPQAEDLTAFLGLVLDRTIRSKGIEYLGLLYQSHELQLLRRRPGSKGRKWTVKADPFDLSSISVLDETGQKWVDVPSTDPDLTDGLNIREYRRVLDEARIGVRAGQKIYVSHLLEARRKLMAFGKEKGVKPASALVEIDVDWFRTNVDCPIVRVDDRRSGDVGPFDRIRRGNQNRRDAAEAAAAAPPPRTDLPRMNAPPLQPALEHVEPTAVSQNKVRRRRLDPDDPENWS